MGRTWWPFLIGTLMGCSPRVTVEEESSGSTTTDGPTTTSGVAESTTSAGVTSNPSGPSPTGPNPTSPVTSATAVGTTTGVGVGVDTGIGVTGDVDTGIGDSGVVLDVPSPPEEACIPPQLHGPAIEAHPGGWIAFEGCEPSSVIIQRPGAPALLTGEEVTPVFMTYGQALFGMPGAVATGIAPCCDGMEPLCLSVELQASELQIGESLAYASELFVALDPECVGIRFQLLD